MRMRPIYDPLDILYKSRTGAVPTGEAVTFTLLLPVDTGSTWANLCVDKDGKTRRFPMTLQGREGDRDRWYCTLTPEKAGIYSYYFEAEGSWVPAIIKMDEDLTGTFNYERPLFQLTVYEKGYETPDWLKGGVMYQIFPDRFCRGQKDKVPMEGRILRDDWGAMPHWQPDGQGKILNNDFFGGDLAGITEKLPYLAQLGVTCLYLNPVFYAGSNHRYDTWDYETVDPWLGSEEDLRRLCREAGEFGIRILLDGVFSHNGDTGRYFDRYGTWEPKGACHNGESPFRSWFSIREDGSYDSWWGIDTLPEVNELDPSYLEYICGEKGILQKWLRCGISGWRLDVADELPDGFLFALRDRVKATDPQALILGEVWEDASTKVAYDTLRPYLLGHQLDSVMNYPFKEAILQFLTDRDGDKLVRTVRTVLDHYPAQTVQVLMNFISTHDVERAITRLAGKPLFDAPREEQASAPLTPEEYQKGSILLRTAFFLLFFLPGVPCVYYGDEMGMSGYRDPFNRGCMDWNGDREIHDLVAALGRLRREEPVFADSRCDLRFFHGVLTLRRGDLLLTVNVSAAPVTAEGEPLLGDRIVAPDRACITRLSKQQDKL